MLEQLRELIGSHRGAMAKLTGTLVAIDTENPRGPDHEQCLQAVVYALTAVRLLPRRVQGASR